MSQNEADNPATEDNAKGRKGEEGKEGDKPDYSKDPERVTNREKFETELEFVQCLANPYYLQFLHQSGLFKDPEFLEFLNYLLYWKKSEYARFLHYPLCLSVLSLLAPKSNPNPEFRECLGDELIIRELSGKLLASWSGIRPTEAELASMQKDQNQNQNQASSSGSGSSQPQTGQPQPNGSTPNDPNVMGDGSPIFPDPNQAGFGRKGRQENGG